MTDGVIVLITASSAEEAAMLAKSLVDAHLAACVNVVPAINSFFFWEGKTQDAREALLICKSRRPFMRQIIDRVKSLHSYSLPEIIALPIVDGSQEYLDWVKETTRGSG